LPDTPPPDPFTHLAEGAAQAHELFSAYVGAGFRRDEALQILIGIMAAAFSNGPRPERG
jgi:hypothetical protein